jgi:hypothetical protein
MAENHAALQDSTDFSIEQILRSIQLTLKQNWVFSLNQSLSPSAV